MNHPGFFAGSQSREDGALSAAVAPRVPQHASMSDQKSKNAAAATAVGPSAPSNSPPAPMLSSEKWRLSSATPAGFGAFAITVRPPPAAAPARSMYFDSLEISAMSDPRYVSAALSVMAVKP